MSAAFRSRRGRQDVRAPRNDRDASLWTIIGNATSDRLLDGCCRFHETLLQILSGQAIAYHLHTAMLDHFGQLLELPLIHYKVVLSQNPPLEHA